MNIIKNLFLEVFNDTWPSILIAIVIAVSLRLAYLIKGRKKLVLYKELLMLIFIIYALCLFYVVSYQDENYGLNNFRPFAEIFRYEIGSDKFIKNILGNIVMFMPFGFFAGYFLNSKKITIPLILTILLTITIETVQYYIGRVFDIDDIILNILGGIIGYILYILLTFLGDRYSFFRKPIVLNIIVVLVIILVIMYGFNIDLSYLFEVGGLCLR